MLIYFLYATVLLWKKKGCILSKMLSQCKSFLKRGYQSIVKANNKQFFFYKLTPATALMCAFK